MQRIVLLKKLLYYPKESYNSVVIFNEAVKNMEYLQFWQAKLHVIAAIQIISFDDELIDFPRS